MEKAARISTDICMHRFIYSVSVYIVGRCLHVLYVGEKIFCVYGMNGKSSI